MLPPADLPQRQSPIVTKTLITATFALFVLLEVSDPTAAIVRFSFYPASLTGWDAPLPFAPTSHKVGRRASARRLRMNAEEGPGSTRGPHR